MYARKLDESPQLEIVEKPESKVIKFPAAVQAEMRSVVRNPLYRAYVAVMTTMALAMPSFAQSLQLDVDVQPLFDNANQYIPTFMSIYGIPFGIAIAFAIVGLIGGAIVAAIRNSKM